MRYMAFVLFCVCLTGCYYLLTLASLEYTTADEIAALLNISASDDDAQLAKNVLIITLAGLIPAFLAHIYEPRGKWLCVLIAVAGTVFLHGNTGIQFWDPVGFERFMNSYFYADNPTGITLGTTLILSPIIWLSLLTFVKPARRDKMWMHPD